MNPAKLKTKSGTAPKLPPLGAHMSVAGGVDRAIDRAREAGCTALQIFLKNNNQWSGKPFEASVIERFRQEIAKGDLGVPVAHASYLVNLASADAGLLERSMTNLKDDLGRAEQLGVSGLVLHPGAHMGRGEEVAIAQIADQINKLFDQTKGNPAAIYLEGTAGQGSAIGHRFEHLRAIIDGIEDKSRIGVCLDTCHIFAAGYDIRTRATAKEAISEFDRVVGLGWMRVFHFNDSKKGLGSRVDRHTHIGQGEIGEEGFAALMQDPRLIEIPRILETPKEEDLAEDKMNLATLRRLACAG